MFAAAAAAAADRRRAVWPALYYYFAAACCPLTSRFRRRSRARRAIPFGALICRPAAFTFIHQVYLCAAPRRRPNRCGELSYRPIRRGGGRDKRTCRRGRRRCRLLDYVPKSAEASGGLEVSAARRQLAAAPFAAAQTAAHRVAREKVAQSRDNKSIRARPDSDNIRRRYSVSPPRGAGGRPRERRAERHLPETRSGDTC